QAVHCAAAREREASPPAAGAARWQSRHSAAHAGLPNNRRARQARVGSQGTAAASFRFCPLQIGEARQRGRRCHAVPVNVPSTRTIAIAINTHRQAPTKLAANSVPRSIVRARPDKRTSTKKMRMMRSASTQNKHRSRHDESQQSEARPMSARRMSQARGFTRCLKALALCALAIVAAPCQAVREQAIRLGDIDAVVWTSDVKSDTPRPVVVFSHGLYTCATQSRFLTEALADSGYFVIAPNHHDASCALTFGAFALSRLPG